jgi:hypothetical protein
VLDQLNAELVNLGQQGGEDPLQEMLGLAEGAQAAGGGAGAAAAAAAAGGRTVVWDSPAVEVRACASTEQRLGIYFGLICGGAFAQWVHSNFAPACSLHASLLAPSLPASPTGTPSQPTSTLPHARAAPHARDDASRQTPTAATPDAASVGPPAQRARWGCR